MIDFMLGFDWQSNGHGGYRVAFATENYCIIKLSREIHCKWYSLTDIHYVYVYLLGIGSQADTIDSIFLVHSPVKLNIST